MYIALTEDRAKEIRKLGISVIEWKNCVRKKRECGCVYFQ